MVLQRDFINRDDLQIEAFLANHGDISPAYSFKIVTDDISIVISGVMLLRKTTRVPDSPSKLSPACCSAFPTFILILYQND